MGQSQSPVRNKPVHGQTLRVYHHSDHVQTSAWLAVRDNQSAEHHSPAQDVALAISGIGSTEYLTKNVQGPVQLALRFPACRDRANCTHPLGTRGFALLEQPDADT